MLTLFTDLDLIQSFYLFAVESSLITILTSREMCNMEGPCDSSIGETGPLEFEMQVSECYLQVREQKKGD